MANPRFKIVEVNTGHCQITYSTRNPAGERIFYCLQDVHRNSPIRAMRCTQDGEPQNEVFPKDWTLWDLPTGDSRLEDKVREFLKSKVAQ